MFINRFIKFLSSRFFLLGFVLLTQAYIMFSLIVHYGNINNRIRIFLYILNILVVLKVINRYSNTSYKLAWAIIILGLPLAGGITYLLFAEKKVPKKLRGKIIHNLKASRGLFDDKEVNIDDADIKKLYSYLYHNGYYPYYQNTTSEYFSDGELFFSSLLDKLKKAKKFVFIEFFIIKEGYMLETLLLELRNCLARGVRVYMLYDDGGCLTSLDKDFETRLRSMGVKVWAFSPVSIRLTLLSKANNRSHRKIIVIDNECGFTGGYNLADEYINKIAPFGYWKDTGIFIKGEAVWNLTLTFIQFYNASVSDDELLNYYDFKLEIDAPNGNGLYLPFSDSPTDEEDLARTVHLMMINNAKKYLYIHTPYLILDYDMTNALMIAAKSGVDIRITLPYIPDKKMVNLVTKSHYKELIKAGVKIYEYLPGFIHSKLFVSDDKLALVGTCNMDYRSYYLNYECGVLLAQDEEIMKMKEDYMATLSKSKEISLEEATKVNIFNRIFRAILNVFAPML